MAKDTKENELEITSESDKQINKKVKNGDSVSKSNINLGASYLINEFEKEQLKKELPDIYVGDTVKVGVKITEGNKERIQPYEGVVIAKRHGGLNQTMAVRRIFQVLGLKEFSCYIVPCCFSKS